MATTTGDLLEYPIRIIDTHTLDLETDTSLYANHYAILSHTWLQAPEKEVVFAEVEGFFAKVKEQWPPATIEVIVETYSHMVPVAEKLEKSTESKDGSSAMQIQNCEPAVASTIAGPGIMKLLCAIDTARRMGYRYLWVDSCCNNQSNQKELQKALVSMAQWYANAHVCLVFLENCPFEKDPLQKFLQSGKTNFEFWDEFESYFKIAKWSTRGWTVQEIIMCRRAIFLNRKWESIVEYDCSVLFELEKEPEYLVSLAYEILFRHLANVPLDLICVGQRPDAPATRILSLPIFRQTTRPEDRAYSLMGILGVQMEVRYGEGLLSALERLCNCITGPQEKSVLDWLDKVKRSDEPEQRELDFIFVSEVQVGELNTSDLRRGLLALAKHEMESGTVGTTYQFECNLNNFDGHPVKIPIQTIISCPLAAIQDMANRMTVWAIAKLPHTKGDQQDLFLCSVSIGNRAQIKSPSSDWIPGEVFVRRLSMVRSFLESSAAAKDVHELFGKYQERRIFNVEGDFNDQHPGLEKGKNITQDLRRYIDRYREQEAAVSNPDSATRVAMPWVPE